MTTVVVGLDVGGTKTAIVVETVAGERLVDTVVASSDWDAEPLDYGVGWVRDRLSRVLPAGTTVAALVIGAQGLDTPEIAREFADALGAGFPVAAVNDAALLVPAAGYDAGIGLISGTGAIGVGATASGDPLITGGWGWVIGDEAGAAGIVREATRAALLAHDDGLTDDGLLGALLSAFGAEDAERLARVVNDEPTMDNWGPRAPAVFAAADAGSPLALAVVDGAVRHLARLVDQLLARGAAGSVVIAAGGVVTRQPRLFDGLSEYVREKHPSLAVELLTHAPVEGALRLARRAL